MGELQRRRAAEHLARIIDQQSVQSARQKVLGLVRGRLQAGPPTDVIDYARREAQAYDALADALEAEGRLREALLERARAVTKWREAEEDQEAAVRHTAVLVRAVQELRDTELAQMVEAAMTAPRHPRGPVRTPEAPVEYLVAAALAEIWRGIPGMRLPGELAQLRAKTPTSVSVGRTAHQ